LIIGIGVDLIEIERVAKVCRENPRFLERMFSEGEREWSFRNRKHPYQHLAACFAAREAFFKATNLRFRARELEVCHYDSGMPYFRFHGALREKMERLGWEVHLTISHHRSHAVVVVVVEEPES